MQPIIDKGEAIPSHYGLEDHNKHHRRIMSYNMEKMTYSAIPTFVQFLHKEQQSPKALQAKETAVTKITSTGLVPSF